MSKKVKKKSKNKSKKVGPGQNNFCFDFMTLSDLTVLWLWLLGLTGSLQWKMFITLEDPRGQIKINYQWSGSSKSRKVEAAAIAGWWPWQSRRKQDWSVGERRVDTNQGGIPFDFQALNLPIQGTGTLLIWDLESVLCDVEKALPMDQELRSVLASGRKLC